MVNEAVVTDFLGNAGDPIEYTCLDNTGILKGTLLELEDLRTTKAMSAADKPTPGLAAMEKVADDGSTTISVYTNVIAKMNVGTTGVTAGKQVVAEGAGNSVKDYDTLDEETGDVLGYALETGTQNETVLIRVIK